MIAYKTSKDYKHLIELLDKGIEVVCFYTYVWNECDKDRPDYEQIMVTDACTAKLLNKGTQDEQYVISCRGTGFLNYWTKDMPYSYTFEELLKAREIEYIEPDSIINNSLQEEPVSEDLKILTEEEKKVMKLDIVNRMSTELGGHCIKRMLEEKMSLVEIFSTISIMSCMMIDSLASSTGRDSRMMIDGYINTVKAYKVQDEK